MKYILVVLRSVGRLIADFDSYRSEVRKDHSFREPIFHAHPIKQSLINSFTGSYYMYIAELVHSLEPIVNG